VSGADDADAAPARCAVERGRNPRRGNNQEQQLRGPRKADQDKTDSDGLARRYVVPKAEFSDPFPE
jgi:hypothetical protein